MGWRTGEEIEVGREPILKIGEYEIKGELGRGGMATVYRGYDPGFDREVAIKVLPREFLHDPTFRERFRHEAKIIGSLEHPAIVPVYYFGEEEGQPFIVMRYMAGGSLAERLAQGPLPLDEIIRILAALAPALDEAHERGILHRDLKPGNILFDHRNAPYIGDFGIAKLTESSQALSSTGSFIGTPAYMSPEQARGESKLDRQSDIYALGAILFEMLTGRLPYQADTPMGMALRHISDPIPALREARGDVPAALQTIIDRAMAKQRTDRYATAADLLQALQVRAGLAPDPGLAPADIPTERLALEPSIPAPPQSPALPQNEPRAFPLLWLLVFVLLLGGAAFLLQNLSGAPEATPDTTPDTGGVQTSVSPSPTLPPSLTPTLPRSPVPTLPTLGLGSTQRSDIDGMTLIFVPEGEFLRGASSGDALAKNDEKPQHTVTLDAFWIDETEVTNSMYGLCVADGACQPPDPQNSDSREIYFGEPEFATYPVINVSWEDATAYCAWAGRRLPTEAEWEKAARGTDGRIFSWGNDLVTGERLNFCDQNCPFDYKNGNIDDGFPDTAPVGSHPAGTSPFGAFDMGGNVWEWVNDWYAADYYTVAPAANPPGPDSGPGKVLRGGAWDDVVRSVTERGVLGANERRPFLGFRCAQTP